MLFRSRIIIVGNRATIAALGHREGSARKAFRSCLRIIVGRDHETS